MKLAKLISLIGLIAMTVGLLNGFINGDFFKEGSELLKNPWGIMSMIDLYVGFMLFSGWIIYREKHLWVGLILTFFMMVLGFFTASLYLLIVLYRSKNLKEVLLGIHYD